MKRSPLLYLQDILQSLNYIEKFIHQMDYRQFFADEKTKYAVVRSLEVIGEATKNIPKSVRQKYKNVPWRQMAQMRDKIAHFYFGIDYDIV